MQDDAAVALFGVMEKKVEFEDVTLAENLLKKGKDCLQDVINATVSIELSTADLHNLDVDIEAFRIGDNVRVISKPHGLDRYFLLSKLHLTLDKASSCTMTLGATFKTFTQNQIESQKKLQNAVQNTSVNVEDLSKNVQQVETKVENIIVNIPTEYVKTEDFEDYKTNAEKTYAKSTDLTKLEEDINTNFVKNEALVDYYLKSEVDTMISALDERIKVLEGGSE